MDASHASISAEWVDLAPGLRAWLARPAAEEQPPGIAIYIEAFGVNQHMRSVARRFAEAGYMAIVPDIYHGQTFDYADLDGALAAVGALEERRVIEETALALDRLHEAGASGRPAVVGYCLGGRLAFRAGLELGGRLSAVVAYYGGGIAPEKDRLGREPLIGRASELDTPILLHYGAKDASIAPAEHGRIAAALSQAGKRYVLSVYPDAGHGFDCPERASYAPDAAAEAWRLSVQFLGRRTDAREPRGTR